LTNIQVGAKCLNYLCIIKTKQVRLQRIYRFYIHRFSKSNQFFYDEKPKPAERHTAKSDTARTESSAAYAKSNTAKCAEQNGQSFGTRAWQ
jgi:hypothetical protein